MLGGNLRRSSSIETNSGGDVVGKAGPILDLLPELRIEIYHHAFSTQELTKQVPMPGQAIFPPLMRTCHFIRNEGHVLYRQHMEAVQCTIDRQHELLGREPLTETLEALIETLFDVKSREGLRAKKALNRQRAFRVAYVLLGFSAASDGDAARVSTAED
ncbi:hypothetical protein B0A55_06869 [Friedmanniomyces simplex]|uniref:Uncharacterized protein n=1 Tax=Friedmanniomyces simplex TaxID=329884 RepID=A0A4U0WVQ9_9PEZI|nr:hypothetical protein B0A55_06869 [Friedmanniomyces simplex]